MTPTSAEDFQNAVMYGRCLVCHAPRCSVRRTTATTVTLAMVCSADESHGPD